MLLTQCQKQLAENKMSKDEGGKFTRPQGQLGIVHCSVLDHHLSHHLIGPSSCLL